MNNAVHTEVGTTIVVTTYNRWDLCARALRSILQQRELSDEVILIDDHSTAPPSTPIQELIATSTVRYLRHTANRGLAAARNSAIRIAERPYIALCDDDDIWDAEMLTQLKSGIRAPGAQAAIIVPRDREVTTAVAPLRQLFLGGITPPVSSQMYDTELLRRVRGYNERIRSGVDHDLWIRLLALDPAVSIVVGRPAIVGTDAAGGRMTTREAERRASISESLSVWRQSIISAFGPDFFRHFQRSYERHLNYSFFRNEIAQGRLLDAARRLGQPGVMPQLAAHLRNRISGARPVATFTPYPSDIY